MKEEPFRDLQREFALRDIHRLLKKELDLFHPVYLEYGSRSDAVLSCKSIPDAPLCTSPVLTTDAAVFPKTLTLFDFPDAEISYSYFRNVLFIEIRDPKK